MDRNSEPVPSSVRSCQEKGNLYLQRSSHMAAFLTDTKEKGPPLQAHTLRDFEKHLNDLKKENFSLKLRIYFLEDRIQQKYEDSSEDVYKRDFSVGSFRDFESFRRLGLRMFGTSAFGCSGLRK